MKSISRIEGGYHIYGSNVDGRGKRADDRRKRAIESITPEKGRLDKWNTVPNST
jgi:hypothetical protein